MMSTKMICGRWSEILASASKPSTAVTTSHPSFRSKVSAVRRMVFESSMTMTFKAGQPRLFRVVHLTPLPLATRL
jgi:hypothetical protein